MTVKPTKRNFDVHNNQCTFYVDNSPIESVTSFLHLGHLLTSTLCDSEEITNRRAEFIGQVNNVLCFFRKLSSFVRYRLFQSFCTSYYGCELWSLDNKNIDGFCAAWRQGVRKSWNIPPRTHSYLLPLICDCLPIFDELCLRFLRFAFKCISHTSDLIRSVSLNGIVYGRGFSLLGRNVAFCMQRYNISVYDVLGNAFAGSVYAFVQGSRDFSVLAYANLLVEVVKLRDGEFVFSSNDQLWSREDFSSIIDNICLS